jgi:hypothetical protein
MEGKLLRTFQSQVAFQCRVARESSDHLAAAITGPGDAVSVFIHVQNLLNAAANLSKALWARAGSSPPSASRYGRRSGCRPTRRCGR